MTFGMPRALFVVLSLRAFHTGAAGAGLLYASVSFGAAKFGECCQISNRREAHRAADARIGGRKMQGDESAGSG